MFESFLGHQIQITTNEEKPMQTSIKSLTQEEPMQSLTKPLTQEEKKALYREAFELLDKIQCMLRDLCSRHEAYVLANKK